MSESSAADASTNEIPGQSEAPGAPEASGARPGKGAALGAMFLMATSAIGPGFLTQTSVFTVQMGAALGFAILISIIIDIAVQLNVWRVLTVSGKRANELGNIVLPGLGWALAALVFIGGVAFNIGNIAGAGLGMNAMFGMDAKLGGLLSALVGIGIFLSKKAGVALDRIIVILGAVMILLMLYVAIASNPPVGEALKQTVLPDDIDFFVITTLVGGTVGGYITFAGAHRLIDSGITGPENAGRVTRISVSGVVVTGIMRILLFLAVLGVVATGVTLAEDNTAADAFYQAAGEVGLRMFGMVLWAAGVSSVVGAAYTSITFVTTQNIQPRNRNLLTVAFIAVWAVIFLILGTAPQTLLIFAGAFNGVILPIAFALVLWVAWKRRDLLKGYSYPKWLLVVGAVVLVLEVYLGWNSLTGIADLWN